MSLATNKALSEDADPSLRWTQIHAILLALSCCCSVYESSAFHKNRVLTVGVHAYVRMCVCAYVRPTILS